jgi:obg-like ATPase 1
VKKAGGKYKMLPLFTETTTKIKEVSEKRTLVGEREEG